MTHRDSLCVKGISIHQFVKDLKLAKVFTQKQCLVIENLYIYINDLKVYKVIIALNPSMMKKAKKLGFNNQYQTTYIDDVEINANDLNISKGKYIAIYDPNTADCSIHHGEVDEADQIQRFKRPNYSFA